VQDKFFMPAAFIGRFQPFHNGHLEAIKWIFKKKKEIFIIIGSLQEFSTKDNPFSFQERKKMIEKALLGAGIKSFKIYGVPDSFDDVLWAEKVLEISKTRAAAKGEEEDLSSSPLKKKEISVFTQNSWTKRCLEKISVNVFPHSIFFNGLSATQIREKILKNEKWEDLVPKEVLKYLEKIKGAERIKFLQIQPEERIIDFIRKALKKTGLRGGIMGISGGIDSSVTACLVKKALGKKAIFLCLTFIKSCPLKDNVSLLEKKIKTKIKRIYLGDIYENFLKILPEGDEIAKGNLKPRLRMATLYYFANLYNLLVIGTTNKSEMEIGFFTKFGDGGVDVEPIADLYKTEVIEMAKRLKLPKEIIETVPTADLWPGQTDEKEIGLNYQKLDTILKLLNQDFKKKEISLLTDISENKIKKILERKKKNVHKLSLPPCASSGWV